MNCTLPNVGGLLLAAGQSVRAGAVNKLLLSAHCVGQTAAVTLLESATTALLDSCVTPVVVITGHQQSAVKQCLADKDVKFVNNPEYRSGMASSLVTGVQHLAEHDAVVVALADMPLIASDVIDSLVATFAQQPSSHYVVPTFDGQPGNPVLISRSAFAEVLLLTGDTGARQLWSRENSRVVFVDTACEGILQDVDTVDDLRRIH